MPKTWSEPLVDYVIGSQLEQNVDNKNYNFFDWQYTLKRKHNFSCFVVGSLMYAICSHWSNVKYLKLAYAKAKDTTGQSIL